jgi:hypothetical protein
LKKLFQKIFSFTKVKIGKVELESGEIIEDRRKEKRRSDDKSISAPCVASECPKYEILAEAIAENTAETKDIKKRIEKVEQHQDESWQMLLKANFYSPTLPMPDRLYYGLRYIWWIAKNGIQNGSTREDVIRAAFENHDLYLAITRADDRLRLQEVENSKKGTGEESK